jgi:hypothetical protein
MAISSRHQVCRHAGILVTQAEGQLTHFERFALHASGSSLASPLGSVAFKNVLHGHPQLGCPFGASGSVNNSGTGERDGGHGVFLVRNDATERNLRVCTY